MAIVCVKLKLGINRPSGWHQSNSWTLIGTVVWHGGTVVWRSVYAGREAGDLMLPLCWWMPARRRQLPPALIVAGCGQTPDLVVKCRRLGAGNRAQHRPDTVCQWLLGSCPDYSWDEEQDDGPVSHRCLCTTCTDEFWSSCMVTIVEYLFVCMLSVQSLAIVNFRPVVGVALSRWNTFCVA